MLSVTPSVAVVLFVLLGWLHDTISMGAAAAAAIANTLVIYV